MVENMSVEDFSTTEIVKSDEIDQMSELLHNFYEDLGKRSNYLLVSLYVPVIPVAVIANILVIVVVLQNGHMRSATGYFVINLSVADLLVTTVCMPMAMSQAVSITGLHEELLCKFVFYLQGVAVAASVFTIMMMSIDRCLAIRNSIPFRRSFNRKRVCIVIAVIWTASLTIFGPLLKAVTVHRLDEHILELGLPGNSTFFTPPPISICVEDLESLGINAHLFGIVCFILVYALPGTVVVIVYLLMCRTLYTRKPPFDTDSIKGSASLQQGSRLVRERKRVAWILLILAILFALCWFPYNVLRLLIDLRVITGTERISDVLSYSLFAGHTNSMLNPVVYCSMSRTFRRSIYELLCHRSCGVTRRKAHKNTLALVAWPCSSRGVQNRIPSSQGTSLFTAAHKANAHTRVNQAQSITPSTACDSLNRQQHSPHWRCYKYTKQQLRTSRQNSQLSTEVSIELR